MSKIIRKIYHIRKYENIDMEIQKKKTYEIYKLDEKEH